MNISVRWLSDMLGTTIDPNDAAERLAMLGAPVESIKQVNAELGDVIVAQVERAEKHPNADRLTLCQVNNGREVVEVVCGAPNVVADKKYPYAPVGAVLPGGLKLTKRKIRGVQSNGMLCSARELELGADQDGILELDESLPLGERLLDVLQLDDHCLDVEVTPNRPDLLCHKGVARDLGAALGKAVKLPPIEGGPPQTAMPVRVMECGSVGTVKVVLEDREGCPRYMAAGISGVTVGPSPDWLQARLRNIGQRPINNVVDATNYILFELNQPMHAFDMARLAGSRIIIRRARQAEKLLTLDGEQRPLDPEMTAICDAVHATAVGGVIGGSESEVSAETTDIVLECAYFDPKRIRATRKRLKTSTEASYRFERGTDIQGMPDALRRAVALVIAVAGGREMGPPVDVYPEPVRTRAIFLRPERVERLLGVEIPQQEIEGLLTKLGFSVGPKNGRLAVHVPGWRPDVSREEDLVEEIARLRGYDSFPSEMRPQRPSSVPDDPSQPLEGRVRRVMTGLGLHEARSSSLGPRTSQRAQGLLNPLSVEEGFLRSDLVSGLARAVEHNWAVRERNIRMFEIGSVFEAMAEGGLPRERRCMAAVVSGARHPEHWTDGGKSDDFDLWDLKGLLSEALRAGEVRGELGVDDGYWVIRGTGGMHLGTGGELKLDAPAWSAPVFYFEIELRDAKRERVRFEALAAMPSAERDLALILPAEVSGAQVESVVRRSAGKLLESVRAFDEFKGKDVGGRSVAWRLVFRSPHRTLRDKEVDAAVNKVLTAVKEQLGVVRRET